MAHPNAASVARYRQRQKARGLCQMCPRKIFRSDMCREHLAHKARYRSEWHKFNYVPTPRVPVSAEHKRLVHLEAVRRYQKNHAKLGLCRVCPRPVVPGTDTCEKH